MKIINASYLIPYISLFIVSSYPLYLEMWGARGSVVVKALYYKLERRGIDSR
jgi:hypothetical protein